ncbi:hypothetical protein HDU96_003484, partial [Phlyctochytrium bullatum]
TKAVKVKVKVFEGKDFHIWKRRMITDLKAKGLWHVVEKPFAKSAVSNTAADIKAHNALVLADAQAKNRIESRLADQFLSTITVEMTAKEAWDKLEALYERKTLPNRNFLTRKLTRVLQEKDESIQVFKARLMRVLEELVAAGEQITEEQK